MEEKRPKEHEIELSNLILGLWLLTHDLADRAIHSVDGVKNLSIAGDILNRAHKAERWLKKNIKDALSSLGLATREDLKELEDMLYSLKKRR